MCHEQIMSCERKARYRTQGFAQHIAFDYKRRGVSLRVYLCNYCKGYHLTHREKG